MTIPDPRHAAIPFAETTFRQRLGEPTEADLNHDFEVGQSVTIDDDDLIYAVAEVRGMWIGLQPAGQDDPELRIARRASRVHHHPSKEN